MEKLTGGKYMNSVIFNDEMNDKILSGITKLYEAVSCTLGPSGRNVIISKDNGKPFITNDGVTIASSIELDDEIENKNHYRNPHRHSQASFTDNSSEWRTNKEEDETCQRKSQFLMPGSHVPSKAAFSLRYIKALKTPVTPRTLCTADGWGYKLLFLPQWIHNF